jgi:uncharacterized Zn finger protein (UPF0148 family)
MRWLSALFGRKKTCPRCGFDFSNATFTVSSSKVGCPICGTDITSRLDFVDLRPHTEKQIEREAQSDIGGEDEILARRLVALEREMDTSEEARREIRAIGEAVGQSGGSPRMKRLAYRVQALGGSLRTLEYEWEGICGWMA